MLIDPLGAPPIAPTYREGYPALKLLSVRAAWQRGERECEWRNERHELVARMELLSFSREDVEIWCDWVEGGKRRSRREGLLVRHRPTLTDRRNPDALCGGCRGFTATLFLVAGQWRCAECHRLVPLQSLLSAKEKLLVRVRRLHAKVEGEAPIKGWRTYDQDRMAYEMGKELLRTVGMTMLPENLRGRVWAQWIANAHDAADPSELEALTYRRAEPPTKAARPVIVYKTDGGVR